MACAGPTRCFISTDKLALSGRILCTCNCTAPVALPPSEVALCGSHAHTLFTYQVPDAAITRMLPITHAAGAHRIPARTF